MSPDRCIHFRGGMEACPCKLAIPVRAIFQPQWPCYTGNKGTSGSCEKFTAPNPEAIAADDKEAHEASVRALTAIAAVEALEKDRGTELGKQRAIDCPNCKGENKLHFQRTGRRLYVKCDTPKCVNVSGSYRR